ncbi:MAG TPA: 50S ribosomal protein L29 [Patescibacteria group bacterium]|nr:50S ribosomal protein L29 [Patescibacteria group bacterium]
MKKTDIADLKMKTLDELKRTLLDMREELSKLSIEEKLGKAKNMNARRAKNKDIARVLTFMSLKEMGQVFEEEKVKNKSRAKGETSH